MAKFDIVHAANRTTRAGCKMTLAAAQGYTLLQVMALDRSDLIDALALLKRANVLLYRQHLISDELERRRA